MAYITLDELKKMLPEIMRDWISTDDESWEWIFQEIEQKCYIGKKKKGKKKQIEEKFENLLAEFDVYKKSTDGLQHENVQQGLSIKDIQAEVRRLRDDIKAAKSMAETAKNRTEVDYSKMSEKTYINAAKLTDMEFSNKVLELKDIGMSDLDIAKSMGLTSTWFRHRLYNKNMSYKVNEAQIIQNVYNRMVNRGATREELDNFKAVIKKYDATNYQPPVKDCTTCKHYCGDGVIKEPCIGCADYDCWEAKNDG